MFFGGFGWLALAISVLLICLDGYVGFFWRFSWLVLLRGSVCNLSGLFLSFLRGCLVVPSGNRSLVARCSISPTSGSVTSDWCAFCMSGSGANALVPAGALQR